jgi:hypothetical protein
MRVAYPRCRCSLALGAAVLDLGRTKHNRLGVIFRFIDRLSIPVASGPTTVE